MEKYVNPELEVLAATAADVIASSVTGDIVADSGESAYAMSKAALVGLTKALAKELGPSGIRVNCVAPGVILTDMCANVDPEVLAEMAEETPAGRNGTPEDVARSILFLAGAGADFVTGQVLQTDGGMCI